MRTKQVFRGIIMFVVAFVLSGPSMSFAAGYPDKNIQLVIPTLPGQQGISLLDCWRTNLKRSWV